VRKINVLSLFDGLGGARIALDRLGIECNYYASEIDKYAIKVAAANYPDIIHLGDVCDIKGSDLPQIDLLVGGSPCQGFSFSGKRLNFKDSRSKLFFEFVRLLKECKPKYFLLENVKMKKEYKNIITSYLGTAPILINSKLLTAQNRNRLYWNNIKNIIQPIDKNITWGDIREYYVADNFYYTKKGLDWIKRHSERTGKKLRIWRNDEKCQMIEASHYKNYSSQRFFGILDVKGLRYITPLECERAQDMPDNYTNHVSNTQRYKMIGNAFTIPVIEHILSFAMSDLKSEVDK
jgi:site-specific DNA-cytosine methylase